MRTVLDRRTFLAAAVGSGFGAYLTGRAGASVRPGARRVTPLGNGTLPPIAPLGEQYLELFPANARSRA